MRLDHLHAIGKQLRWAYRGKRNPIPKTFTQKLIYKKLRDRRKYLTLTSDKYAVRDYVAGLVGDSVLTELYAVTDNPNSIPFDNLPTAYVVKATHGSNWCFLVPDAIKVDANEIRAAAFHWLGKDFLEGHEWWYSHIPRRVIVEEYLGDSTGKPPPDYKFWVMHGRVEMIQVDLDRFEAHKRNLFTPEWEPINVELAHPRQTGKVQEPPNLERMLRLAGSLGAGTDFVRVDLYDLGDRVVFGELTHCPGAGYEKFSDLSVDLWLGSRWRLPLRYGR